MAQVLHARSIEIAPEARDGRRAGIEPQHRLRRARALPRSGLPVAAEHVPPEQRLVNSGGVAGRVHVGHPAAPVDVRADARAREQGAREPAHVGVDADSDENVLAFERLAAQQRDGAHALLSVDLCNLLAEQELDSLIAVQIAEPRAQLGAEQARESVPARPRRLSFGSP